MKRIFFLLLICTSFILQGCFDVIEQLSILKNGNGDFELIVNLSRSKTQINSMMKMKTMNGHRVPSKPEIEDAAHNLKNKLESVPGISLVKMELDFKNFIGKLTFHFLEIGQINTAMQKIGENVKDQQQGFKEVFGYNPSAHIFSRINKFAIADGYRKMSIADREIFANSTYTTIYRFEDEVISANNPDCKIAANKRAVMIKSSALDLIKGRKTINNQITLIK